MQDFGLTSVARRRAAHPRPPARGAAFPFPATAEAERLRDRARSATLAYMPAAPCDDCQHRVMCGASGLICLAFESFVKSGHWRLLPRVPAPHLTTQRTWRSRNRARVRANARARHATLKAARPERLLELREYRRTWRAAHPASSRARQQRWRQLHPEAVREQRRRYYWKHRAQLAANRARRATHKGARAAMAILSFPYPRTKQTGHHEPLKSGRFIWVYLLLWTSRLQVWRFSRP
jgi:hypothetical protein